jgi:hypothetical protein
MKRRAGHDRGQAAVLVVVLMAVLVGVMALAIDVGLWYVDKREVQAAADAAALAGAPALVSGQSFAQSAAATIYAVDGHPDDTVAYSFPNASTITVTATRSLDVQFASVLGLTSATVTVDASAQVRAYTTIEGGIAPFGVMRGAFAPGMNYPLYSDNSSSNNGALSLPTENGSGGCAGSGGASAFRDSLAGTDDICPLSVGQVVSTKPGSNAGPTRQGLDERIHTYQPVSSIVRFDATGNAVILDEDSPQLVRIPVVENVNGTTTWPNGSANVRIVGFAWFVITGYSDNGRRIDGVFVRAAAQGDEPTTDWTPGASVYTTELSE